MPAETSPKMFLDSNVLIYALGQDAAKKAVAVALIGGGAVISTQALGEIANVMRRKLDFTPQQVGEVVADLIQRLDVVWISPPTVLAALELAQRYSLSHFDAQIVASALESDCEALYSEDMQSGQVFDRQLRVINPFARTHSPTSNCPSE